MVVVVVVAERTSVMRRRRRHRRQFSLPGPPRRVRVLVRGWAVDIEFVVSRLGCFMVILALSSSWFFFVPPVWLWRKTHKMCVWCQEKEKGGSLSSLL